MNREKYKICFFPGALKLGGVGKLTINLAKEMINQGHEVDFYLTINEGEYLNQIPPGVHLSAGKGGALKSIFSFASYLRKRKPDVVISSRDYLNFLCILITKTVSPKTKVIASVHVDYSGMPKSEFSFNYKLMNLSLKKVYRWADNVIAVSKGVAKNFSYRHNFPLEQIDVIYNPTYDPESYKSEKAILYKDFIDTDNPIIIGVGRLTEQKNFRLLIKAFRKVRESLDAKLIILGEGHLRNDLEVLIDELNLKPYVLLPGFVNNPIDYIKISDVYVMSSSWEGFGNVIVEAMGTGITVVSTDCPSGPAEILDYGKYGTLVPLDDIEKMSKAILNSINNPLEKKMIIKRAKSFSIENITREYLDLIQKY